MSVCWLVVRDLWFLVADRRLFNQFALNFYIRIRNILPLVFRLAWKMALIWDTWNWSAITLFGVNGAWNFACSIGIQETLGLTFKLWLKCVLLTEIAIIFHIVLGKLAWAFTGFTNWYLTSDILGVLFRNNFLFPFLLAFLLIIFFIDYITFSLILNDEVYISFLKVIDGMVWQEGNLEYHAQIIKDEFYFILVLRDWASLFNEMLKDYDQALVYFMIPRKNLLKTCIFIFHHCKKLCYVFVMCFSIVLMDETAIEKDIFGDI